MTVSIEYARMESARGARGRVKLQDDPARDAWRSRREERK